jgi:hypothetical protein
MPPTKPAENSRLVELRSKLQEIEPELIRLSEKPTLTDEESCAGTTSTTERR